jgi:hypothetical protein
MAKGKKKNKDKKGSNRVEKRERFIMPKCECCGEIEEQIYRCKKCDARFCECCGSQEDKLCIECLDEEEYDEDYEEDTYVELPQKTQRLLYRIE